MFTYSCGPVCVYLQLLTSVCLLTAVDECAEGTAVCDVNSICVDIDNGYKCLCKYGYYGNGKKLCKGSYSLLTIRL